MKQLAKFYRPARLAITMTATVLLALGCASVAVTDETLQKNTAFAIGEDIDTFTIFDRVDEGIKTTYSVKTKSGQRYNCYVTGTVSVVGRTVSDAMCNKKGTPAKNPLLGR